MSPVDHVGNLAYLNSDNGFKGKILGSHETIAISQALIKDSVYIHTKNIIALNNKGRKTKPLYTEPQMYDMFKYMEGVNIGEKIVLNDRVTFRLINSGHVLGGCMIELWIKKLNNSIRHIVYSSDMGSMHNNEFQSFVKPMDSISKCSTFISEGTYNNPDRSFSKKEAIAEREQLKKDLKEYLMSGKRILFSAFSFQRVQSLMVMFYEFFKDEEWFEFPVVVDGMLLHKINGIYSKVLEGEEKEYWNKVLTWNRFKMNKTFDSTMATLSQRTVGIYISTSGFMVNGRIVSYLQQFLGNSRDVIYVTGYCGGEGSVGWKILNDSQKTITIDKKVILKRAIVKQLKTFSSHIQFSELMSLFKGLNCERIIIHHSSKTEKEAFGDEIRGELRNVGKSTKVCVVNPKNNQFIL